MNKRMVSVGDLVVDVLLDVRLPITLDDHQMSPALRFEAGGACSTILAARNMGLEVAALGAVGADFQGRMLRDILSAADVDISALVTPANSTTTTVLALKDSRRGGHVFLGHYGQGAPVPMTAAARDLLSRADALFIPGYTLVEDRLQPLIEGVFDFLENHRLPLYLDVGPFLGQLTEKQLERVLRLTDVLMLTEAEIPLVADGGKGTDACRGLISRFELLVVVKRAALGCHILAPDMERLCAGYSVPVVDAVGAGDAFAAALMWANLHRFSLENCGRIANAMGAASVQKVGAGRNVPSREEVQAVLDSNHTGIKLSC